MPLAAASFLAAYVAGVLLYRTPATTGFTETPDVADGVFMGVAPLSVDPVKGEYVLRLVFAPQGGLADSMGRLTRDVTVGIPVVSGGSSSTTYEAGSAMGPIEVRLFLQGEPDNYPFDTYGSELVLGVFSGDEAVPLSVVHDQGVGGWRTDVAFQQTGGVTDLDYRLGRSPAVLAFSILVLALMVAMAALALTLATTVARRRRRVEVTAAGWLAALIFAVVPLRSFLPGAPPVGAWVDVLVVFWVEVVLLAALTIFIVAWVRHGPEPDPPRAPVSPPAG